MLNYPEENPTSSKTDKRYEEHARKQNKRAEDEWERYALENPEWAAQARAMGILGPAPDQDFVKGRGAGKDAQEKNDFAKESVAEVAPNPSGTYVDPTILPTIEAAVEEDDDPLQGDDPEIEARIEARAKRIAAEIIHEYIQMTTRSDIAGFRRCADTVVLAIRGTKGETDDESQAALARRYGFSRAAVSLDVRHILEHGSFGKITERYYNGEKRKKDQERAKEVHKSAKLSPPPANSLAAMLTANLAQPITITKTAKRKTK